MSLRASLRYRQGDVSGSQLSEGDGAGGADSRSRCYFVLRMRLSKREGVPELSRRIIWDHLRQMHELSEMMVAQEAIKLLPHQQNNSFTIFIVTKENRSEEDILSYMTPLLAGERVTTFDDPYRSAHCTPEISISGLINKNVRSTVTALTKIDYDCFYGGLPAGEPSCFDLQYFHNK